MDVFTKGDSIALLGGNWHVFESNGTDSFRWVGDNARLNVAQLTRAPYELVMEVEPGAAVGNYLHRANCVTRESILMPGQTL